MVFPNNYYLHLSFIFFKNKMELDQSPIKLITKMETWILSKLFDDDKKKLNSVYFTLTFFQIESII